MNNVVKKEQMGYWSMILLGINGIIGSGIFLLPNQAAKLIGSASIFVLLFDALLVISIALCFAQAATYFDRDGGPYLYAKDAFGDFVGFEVGFVTWAIRIIAEATMAVAFTTALVGTFPALNPAYYSRFDYFGYGHRLGTHEYRRCPGFNRGQQCD